MSELRPVLGDRWPLVGRERQLAELMSAGGTGVVLVGAAGVGKTRLAREALTRLGSAGRATEWVAATRSTSVIPFGAVSHLLPPEAEPFGEGRLGVLRRVTAHFAALHVNQSSPVVVVDDAHLLDDASAAVVHHLVARELASLIVTVRASEPCPDAVSALWKDGPAVRIGLRELPPDAIDQLLDHAFGDRLDPVSRRSLHRVGAGNPLLLREILYAGLDTGELRHRHGAWRWTGAVQTTAWLAEVVAARLATVDESVHETLEVIAGGEPVPVELLEQIVGSSALASAERRGLAMTEQSGRRLTARLAHPLYGEVIRSTMTPGRARAVAGQLADALARTPMRRRDDALRVGTWQLQSGQPGNAGILLDAAKQAKDRSDLDLAERLARTAGESGGGSAAEQLVAEILADHGRYEQLAGPSPESPNDTSAAVAEGSRCWLLLFDSRCADALELGEELLRSPRTPPQTLVWAASAALPAAGILGEHGRAEEIYRRGVQVAAEHAARLPWAKAQIGYGRCLALLAVGRLDEAWELADGEYRSAAVAETIAPLGGWAGFRGAVAKARGEPVVAAASLREALVLLAGYDTFRMAAPCLAELAGARALSGDARQSARLLDRADSPSRQASRLFVPWIELDRAWVLAAAGDVSAAAAQARKAAAIARSIGQPTTEAWALYDSARLGDAHSVHKRLSEVVAGLPGDVLPAMAVAAKALAVGDPEHLADAAHAFEQSGVWLHAAEAMVSAARLAHEAGLHMRAAAAAERANTLLGRCADARTPLIMATGLPTLLTRREREVALLAAAGHSSREIAGRLRLSVRTVDNYLGRAYLKLGVSSRTDLGPLLGPR